MPTLQSLLALLMLSFACGFAYGYYHRIISIVSMLAAVLMSCVLTMSMTANNTVYASYRPVIILAFMMVFLSAFACNDDSEYREHHGLAFSCVVMILGTVYNAYIMYSLNASMNDWLRNGTLVAALIIYMIVLDDSTATVSAIMLVPSAGLFAVPVIILGSLLLAFLFDWLSMLVALNAGFKDVKEDETEDEAAVRVRTSTSMMALSAIHEAIIACMMLTLAFLPIEIPLFSAG